MNFLAYENGIISFGDALNVSVTGMIVVLIVLAVLAVLIRLISKAVQSAVKKNGEETEKSEALAEEAPAAPETAPAVQKTDGGLELYKTDDKTAAVIMAIVANESGIELNRLKFNSIKLTEE